VGEAEFGLLDGVVKTRQGWIGGREVVEVWYDPAVLHYAELLAHADENECARWVWTRSDAQQRVAVARVGSRAERLSGPIRLDAQQKYYLLKSPLAKLPLSEAQACRVNAALRGNWQRYLSPVQQAEAAALRKADG